MNVFTMFFYSICAFTRGLHGSRHDGPTLLLRRPGPHTLSISEPTFLLTGHCCTRKSLDVSPSSSCQPCGMLRVPSELVAWSCLLWHGLSFLGCSPSKRHGLSFFMVARHETHVPCNTMVLFSCCIPHMCNPVTIVCRPCSRSAQNFVSSESSEASQEARQD